MSPNRNELGFSKKVLYTHVGQEAAKISDVKVGGWKINADSVWFNTDAPWVGWSCRFFFDLQLWLLIFLQPLDLQRCNLPPLKDLNHISLETKAQDYGMTFNVCYVGSKYPHFISNRSWLHCKRCEPFLSNLRNKIVFSTKNIKRYSYLKHEHSCLQYFSIFLLLNHKF